MNDPDRRPTSDGFDHDAIFADIVTHWSDDVVDPGRAPGARTEEAGTPDPASGDPTTGGAAVDDEAADESAVDQPPGAKHRSPVNPPLVLPALHPPRAVPTPLVWRGNEVDDEYEEHFEPPPVAPLPAGDLQFWAIIAGMVGGPLLLLYLVLFNREAGSYWLLTSIAMSVGGFALLVSRLPGHHDDDDDGARL